MLKKFHILSLFLLITFFLHGEEHIFDLCLDTTENATDAKLTLNPIINAQQIKIPGFPSAYNPSIIRNKKGYLLVFRNCPGPSIFISYIGIIQLNDRFRPISDPQLLTTRTDNKTPSRSEDARIFSYNNETYLFYNDNLDPTYPTGISRRDMYAAKLNYVDGKYELLEPIKFVYKDKLSITRWEKNWVPFVWKGHLLFGYSVNPHEVISADIDTGICSYITDTSISINWKWGTIRGGTPAIPFDGEYLAFFHSTVYFPPPIPNTISTRHYYMGAYTFSAEAPFQITKVFPTPLVHKTFYTTPANQWRVIFPSGVSATNDRIYVSYGKNDNEIWVATIDKARLKKMLQHVQPE